LNKGDFTKTTLPIGWLLFVLLAVETYNLSSKLPRKCINSTTPLQERHFPAPLRHAQNSSCIETEKSYLCKVLHFNRQNLLIGPPNDRATAYGSYWKYPTEH